MSATNYYFVIALMSVHSLLLNCFALRASKAWLLTDLRVASCLHSAAVAPASVSASTTKFSFLSGFLECLPSAKRSENLPQSPRAGRDPGAHLGPASVESWCLSRNSPVTLPVTLPMTPPFRSLPVTLLQCWHSSLSLTSLLVLHQPLRALTTHPAAVWGRVGGSLGPVNHAFVGPTCRRGCQQSASREEKGRERCGPSPSQHPQGFPSPSGWCLTHDVCETLPSLGATPLSKAAGPVPADRWCGVLRSNSLRLLSVPLGAPSDVSLEPVPEAPLTRPHSRSRSLSAEPRLGRAVGLAALRSRAGQRQCLLRGGEVSLLLSALTK